MRSRGSWLICTRSYLPFVSTLAAFVSPEPFVSVIYFLYFPARAAIGQEAGPKKKRKKRLNFRDPFLPPLSPRLPCAVTYALGSPDLSLLRACVRVCIHTCQARTNTHTHSQEAKRLAAFTRTASLAEINLPFTLRRRDACELLASGGGGGGGGGGAA